MDEEKPQEPFNDHRCWNCGDQQSMIYLREVKEALKRLVSMIEHHIVYFGAWRKMEGRKANIIQS